MKFKFYSLLGGEVPGLIVFQVERKMCHMTHWPWSQGSIQHHTATADLIHA
jgi:hypothetical protein